MLVPNTATIDRLQHILKTQFILSMDLDKKYIEFLEKVLEDSSFSFITSYSHQVEDIKFAPIVTEKEIADYNLTPNDDEIHLEITISLPQILI